MLSWVLKRLARARRLDRVLVVTTCSTQDDELCAWLANERLPFYRGSESDVLDRYYQAALATGAEHVVRITSDCPLIDPDLVDEVVTERQRAAADYVSNFGSKKYPLGLSAEICTFQALRRAFDESTQPYERVHVTPYFYLNPERFVIAHTRQLEEDYSHLRLTVDTPEDLSFLRALYASAGEAVFTMGWRQIVGLIDQFPHLERINHHVQQKALHEL